MVRMRFPQGRDLTGGERLSSVDGEKARALGHGPSAADRFENLVDALVQDRPMQRPTNIKR
ncbi:hypothetical protein OG232_03960 [Streptomyces sp. NBC_01411]|uniref:hypothetical protein n=1 Tax=Streptomyces sp. NBC_01411 TaxID=2903857 RepID=UPI00324700F0